MIQLLLPNVISLCLLASSSVHFRLLILLLLPPSPISFSIIHFLHTLKPGTHSSTHPLKHPPTQAPIHSSTHPLKHPLTQALHSLNPLTHSLHSIIMVQVRLRNLLPSRLLLSVNQVRSVLGLTDDPQGPVPIGNGLRDAIFVGNELGGDLEWLDGMNFPINDCNLNIIGAMCTTEITENSGHPMGLGTLMTTHYNFEQAVYKLPKFQGLGVSITPTFLRSHNTFYDSIAHIKCALALMMDSTFKTGTFHSSQPSNEPIPHSIDDFIQSPIHPRPNTILLALDTEGHDDQTPGVITEYGFAWLDLEKCRHVAPGIHGINWHRFIEARYYRNSRFPNHRLESNVVAPFHNRLPAKCEWYDDDAHLMSKLKRLFSMISMQQTQLQASPVPIGTGRNPSRVGDFPVYSFHMNIIPGLTFPQWEKEWKERMTASFGTTKKKKKKSKGGNGKGKAKSGKSKGRPWNRDSGSESESESEDDDDDDYGSDDSFGILDRAPPPRPPTPQDALPPSRPPSSYGAQPQPSASNQPPPPQPFSHHPQQLPSSPHVQHPRPASSYGQPPIVRLPPSFQQHQVQLHNAQKRPRSPDHYPNPHPHPHHNPAPIGAGPVQERIDLERVDTDDTMVSLLRSTCPDNLQGQKCKQSGCTGLKLCPGYNKPPLQRVCIQLPYSRSMGISY